MADITSEQTQALMDVFHNQSQAFKHGGQGLSASTVSSLAGLVDATGNLQKATQIANKMNYIGNTLGAFHRDSKRSDIFKPLSQTVNTLNLAKMVKGFFPKKDTRVKSTKTIQQNPQEQFDDIGSQIANAQKEASLGVAETLGGSFKEGLRDLGSTISTDVKEGISGVRDAHRDYFELRDNNITSAMLDVQDSVTGWALQAGKTMLGGGKDVADTTVGAISNLTNTVKEGNQDIQDTLNNNLQGSPPYLRTLAESQKPAARKKALLDEMNTETEGNIKQIRKKRFRLIREYKELYFKPLAKEIVKAQAGGIFKKAFSAATLAYEVNWKKNVMAELTSIRRAVGGNIIDPWAKEKDFLASMPIIGNLFKKKPVEIQTVQEQTTEEGETTTSTATKVKVDDGRVKMYDGEVTIEAHAKDALILGTNLFEGLKSSIEGLSTSMSTTIQSTLLEKVGGLDKVVDQSLLNQQSAFEGLIGTLPSWEGFMDKFQKEDHTEWTSELLSINDEIKKQSSILILTKTLIGQQVQSVREQANVMRENFKHYTQNPADILPDLETKWNEVLGPKSIEINDLVDMSNTQLQNINEKLKTDPTNSTLTEQKELFENFIEQDKKYVNNLSKETTTRIKYQNDLKKEEKKANKHRKEIERYERLGHLQMTEEMTKDMGRHHQLLASIEGNIGDLEDGLKDSQSREQTLENNRRSDNLQSVLEQIKENTGAKRDLQIKDKEGGLKGLLQKIPGMSNLLSLFTAISGIGILAGQVLAPALGLLKVAGPFLTFAKLFSVVGLVAILLKPLHSALKVFQEEEGTFGEKLKKAGWTFVEGIVGSITGVLATVADAFGLGGLADFFRDIKEKGIKAPIEKFFSEGIGLQIKNTLGPVFELLKTGFNTIFSPIKAFLGPGGQGEGIGNALQDIFKIMKFGFTAFMSVFDSIMYAIEPAIDIFKKHIKFLGDIFQMAMPTLKSIGSLFMNVAKIVLPLLMGIGAVMFKVMAPIVRLILKSFGVLQDILYPLIKGLFFGINTAIQAIVGIANAILEPFDFTSFDNALASLINFPGIVINLPIKLLGKLTSWFTGLIGLDDFSKKIADASKDFNIGKLLIDGLIDGLKAMGIKPIIDEIISGLAAIPGAIGEEFKAVSQAIITFLPNIGNRLFLLFTEFPYLIIQRGKQILGRALDFPWVGDIIARVKDIFGFISKPINFLSDTLGKIPIFGKTFKGGIDGAIAGFKGGGALIEEMHKLGGLPTIKPGAATTAGNAAKRLSQWGDVIDEGAEGVSKLFKSLGTDGIFGKIGDIGQKTQTALTQLKTPKAALSNFKFIDNWFASLELVGEYWHKVLGDIGFLRPIQNFILKIQGFIGKLTAPLESIGKIGGKLGNFGVNIGSEFMKIQGFIGKLIFKIFEPVMGFVRTIGRVFSPLADFIKPILQSPALKAGLKANPIGFIFTAVDALIQGVTGFMEGFKTDGLLGGLQGALEGVFMALFGDMIDMIVKLPVKAVGWIIGLFPGGDELKAKIFEWADTFSIKNLLSPLFQIKDHIQGFIDGFAEGGLMKGIEGLLSSLYQAPLKAIDGIINKVLGLFNIEANFDSAGFLKPVTDGIAQIMSAIGQIILLPVTVLVEPIRTFIQNIQQGQPLHVAIFEAIKSILLLPINIFKQLATPFAKLAAWLWENIIPDWLKENAVVKAITGGIKDIFQKVTDVWDSIKQKIDDLIPDWIKKDPEKEARATLIKERLDILNQKEELSAEQIARELEIRTTLNLSDKEQLKGLDGINPFGKKNEKRFLELRAKQLGGLETQRKIDEAKEKAEALRLAKEEGKTSFEHKGITWNIGPDGKATSSVGDKSTDKKPETSPETNLKPGPPPLTTEMPDFSQYFKVDETAVAAIDPTINMSKLPGAVDLTSMTTMVKTDPVMIDANETRKNQLNEVISQLQYIYQCLTKIETPIVGLDKANVADQIKTIASESKTAGEAQKKSAPVLEEIDKKIKAEAVATDDWDILGTAPSELKPVRERVRDENLEKHQAAKAARDAAYQRALEEKAKWEKQHAINVATAEARKAEIEARQRADLHKAVTDIAPTEEEKKESKADSIQAVKQLDESLKTAPIMNPQPLPDFSEMPWTKKLTSTLDGLKDGLKNSPLFKKTVGAIEKVIPGAGKWVDKGMDLLKGTKAGGWLEKGMSFLDKTKAGEGWLGKGKALYDSFNNKEGGGLLGLASKGLGFLTKDKEGEGRLGKGKSLVDAFKGGGKIGFLDKGLEILGGAGGGEGILGKVSGFLSKGEGGGILGKAAGMLSKDGGGILGKAAGLLGKGGAAKAVLGKIPGIGGIMAGAGDIMSGLKSGNYGDVLKGGIKSAVNFIPGIGPIASSVAGPLVDGAFKVFKKFGVGKKLKSFGKSLFGKGKKGEVAKIASKLIESNPLTAGLGEMANAGKALLKGDIKGALVGGGKALLKTVTAPVKGLKNLAQGLIKASPIGLALGWNKKRKAKKAEALAKRTATKKRIDGNSKVMDYMNAIRSYGSEEQKSNLNLTGTSNFGGDEHKMIAHYGSNPTAFKALYDWIGDPDGGYGVYKHPITGKVATPLAAVASSTHKAPKASVHKAPKVSSPIIDYGPDFKPVSVPIKTGMNLEQARAERDNKEMELRSGRGSRGESINAINAPTANVQNNTTYQSVKPSVRDDRRMRTMSIVGS